MFKNQKLQGILRLTEQATIFRATYSEAVEAFEKATNRKYKEDTIPAKYYEHNTPTAWLVKDEGIYLMASAKLDEFPKDKSHICYAEGFEPGSPGCWERSRQAVGGDDFVESIKFTSSLIEGIKKLGDIHVHFTSKYFSVKIVYPNK